MSAIGDLVTTLAIDDLRWGPKLNQATSSAKQFANETISVFNSTRTPFEQTEIEISKMNKMFKDGYLTSELYARGIRQIDDRMNNLRMDTLLNINTQEKYIRELNAAKSGSTTDTIKLPGKAFGFVGREISQLGMAATYLSESLGMTIMQFGGMVSMLPVIEKGLIAVGKAYAFLSSQAIITSVLSGPVGWISLAAGIAAVTAGLTIFYDQAQRAANELKRINDEIERNAAKNKLDLEINYHRRQGPSDLASFLKGELDRARADYFEAESKFNASEGRVGFKEEADLRAAMREKAGILVDLQNKYNEASQASSDYEKAEQAKAKTIEQANRIADAQWQAWVNLIQKGTALAETPFDAYLDNLDALNAAFDAGSIGLQQWMDAEQKAAIAAGIMNDPIKEQQNALEERNKMLEEGRRLTESVMTPQENLNKKIEDYNRLLDVGAITNETYNRVVKAAQDEFEQKTAAKKTPKIREQQAEASKAQELGTREAWNTIVAAMTGRNNDADKAVMETADNTKDMVVGINRLRDKFSAPQIIEIA